MTVLLGSDPYMQLVLRRTLPASLVYAGCALAQWGAVWLGYVGSQPVQGLSAVLLFGALGFYAAVRGGWSQRLADPALTMPQMVYAMLSLGLAYQINWHVRGVLPMIAALVLVFGAFTLAPRACRLLGVLSVAVFGVSMVFGALRDPAHFPPSIEMFHFVFILLVLPLVGHLAGQLSRLRLDQREQQRQLREALDKLQLTATQDELTGLPNRRHMQAWMSNETARTERSGHPLCVAVIDLDHFKSINDLHGHAVGDEALRIFAREARSALRESDMLARWGGEEFLLAMPDTDIDGAARLLERLRSRLAEPAPWAGCPQARLTFSAGLTAHEPSQQMHETVRRADDALYAAKREGRDRLVVG